MQKAAECTNIDFGMHSRKTESGERTLCGRCGETVPASSYSSGTPDTPGRPGYFVATGGSTIQQIPVFQHGGGPTACHPAPVGIVEQVVPAGYHIAGTPGIPGRPWAKGRSTSDHGCESCRLVAEAAHRACKHRDDLRRRLEDLRPELPDGLQNPVLAQAERLPSSFPLIVVVVLVLALGTAASAFQAAPAAGVIVGVICLGPVLAFLYGLHREVQGRDGEFQARVRVYDVEVTEYRERRAALLPAARAELTVAEGEADRLVRIVAEHDQRQRGSSI